MLHEVTWTYIVVDEGHRLKNRNCRLGQELRRIPSKHRMLLTGTPLQNDMEELWSLLNYLQPDLFNHWELFAVSKFKNCSAENLHYNISSFCRIGLTQKN